MRITWSVSETGALPNTVEMPAMSMGLALASASSARQSSGSRRLPVPQAASASIQTRAVFGTLAVALDKIADDIRLMGSGPRAGPGELRLHANEPGSLMMPGTVNPTQVAALTMVAPR